jgi:hypothetical protein
MVRERDSVIDEASATATGEAPGAEVYHTGMARLTSEVEVPCPCCGAILVFDRNLGRIVSHEIPDKGDKPELNHAQRIVAEEAARREAIFEKSMLSERTRGDDLAKRFEEALKQANKEPVSRPKRDFDLD